MNAMTAPDEQLTRGNGGGNRSDSDTDPEDSPGYYQPISAVENGEDGSEFSDDDGDELVHHQLPNGHAPMENELSSLDLSDDEEDEAEEERLQETAIERAMREDERRRNAPLTAENAGRVMETMRGVQFGGPPPHWAGRVPEDEWIHRIRDRSRRALLSAADLSTIRRNP